MTRRTGTLAALVAALTLAWAAPAQGQGGLPLPGLPTDVLPPTPGNSAQTIWPGFDACPGGAASCPAAVILEMYERWRPLSARCDHRAVFALTYLRTTEEFARATGEDPFFFEDAPWVNHEDAVFAELYYRAFDSHLSGGAVPESWRIAFEAAASDDLNGAGDLLLGMNAHINRDLSYTLAAVGLVKPGGGSRKTDHDKVNQFLNNVADPLQAELARRYDPYFETTDAEPAPFDEQAVLGAVRGFRENAWRNAERLVNAADQTARDQVSQDIEQQSQGFAELIRAGNTIPGYGPIRDAYCREHNPPPFRIRIRGRRLAGLLEHGKLRLAVRADGPARMRLGAGLVPRKAARGTAGRRPALGIARRRKVVVKRAGWRRLTLRLTPYGRRVLERRAGARIRVTLQVPRLRERRVKRFG